VPLSQSRVFCPGIIAIPTELRTQRRQLAEITGRRIANMALDDFDFDDMNRRFYREAILRAAGERNNLPPDSEGYRVLTQVITEMTQRLEKLRYKDPR
jgi:hypothetical protein